ncbi:nucleoside-diphosphate kinase [Meiothermus granaticius]|uniref:Nucleoside diphosphate kinase n=1 Tax=Meiothermus granaticius NBRC 107808 TaxID=1227551 RepID=A0A399FB90_9DEIN|nr:nucleoside-diphosphate kinase [Meiothermus granaticius]MCL6526314.1 nucleoside-diphosphate kinase [Thermaceae bacterium]RIH93410.1 Nucleoside diphosphate kinase [Meiothermus granaticius NBRC 107808]GEM87659.1 nucleoside diphosphate kinase [Meiothermus granaticius NBRC 107808]
MADTERTYIMVKPDGVRRGLTGEVIGRIERKGFRIVAMKKMLIPQSLAETHYGEHKGKPFFEGLVRFITSGPVVAMVVEGPGVIAEMRRLMGATRPWEAAPGTIRADFATTVDENIIHGSDGPESAAREIGLFFKPEEILS